MSRLHIGADGFALKAEVFEDVVAILGRRGRGKTTTATVIVEGLHAAGARFVVTDPVGVWWGLRASRDGKRPGIPVIVMGGDHGDVPLASESGELIADFVADPSQPSIVLDLKLFMQGEMVRFMTAFLSRLYHVNPGRPLHIILDEADQFAPQRPMPGEQAMLGAAQRVTKLGRAKGLHPILITQRPATLSKNVLTQAGMLISHAITGPQDRKAVDEWIKANAEEGEREKFLAALSGLPRGTAYFWSPDIPLFRQVAVRDRETFDSSATPKRGERGPKPKALAEVDLEALRGRIAATIEHHKANDPKELRRKVAELQAELRKKAAVLAEAAARPKHIDAGLDRLKLKPPKRVEIAVVKPRETAAMERAATKLDVMAGRLIAHGEKLIAFGGEVGARQADLRTALAAPRPTVTPARALPSRVGAARPAAPSGPPPQRRARSGNGHADAEGLTGTQQSILDMITTLDARGIAVDRITVARWLGIHPNGGRFLTDLARLREAGYITGSGVALTAIGQQRAMARDTGSGALLETLASQKKAGTRRTMMATILDHGPFTSRIELAAKLGIHPNGGRFLTDLARLREMGVIPEKGEVRATEGATA